MSEPPLQLEQSTITRLLVEGVPDHKPGGENELNSTTEIEIGHHADRPEIWRVGLRLQIEPAKQNPGPYRVDLQMYGFFRVPEGTTDDDATKLVGITGASMLYSGAREHLLLVTGRGPWGPLLLPTVTFASPRPVQAPRKATPPKSPPAKTAKGGKRK